MLLGIRLVIRGDGKATISKILVCPAFCFRLVIVFTSTALGAALPLLLSELGVDPAHAGATIQVLLGCRVYSSNENSKSERCPFLSSVTFNPLQAIARKK